MAWWDDLWNRISALLGYPQKLSSPKPGMQAGQPVAVSGGRRRLWTLMVYMAGDNGMLFDTAKGQIKLMAEMTTAGYQDLLEMGAVGTTDRAAVLCLFDTRDATYLVEVRKGRGFADSAARQVPEVNTGDPATLERFLCDTITAYPAEHYALILWNHGTGWVDMDSYSAVRTRSDGIAHLPLFRGNGRPAASPTSRPIGYDDSSKDFLDSRELGQALRAAYARTRVRLDLIGMDACLMAMIEGARELAPYADYFVASQEVEPMAGWPYKSILQQMNQDGSPSGAGLAEAIVTAFTESYGGVTREETVTQSAVALAQTAGTESLCRDLVQAVLNAPSPRLRACMREARDAALPFQDRNFRDLGDFATRLADALTGQGYDAVKDVAFRLAEHLNRRGDGAAVVRVGYLPRYERATGMSVYLPQRAAQFAPDSYRHLAFVRASGWDRLLDWLLAA